MISNDPLLEKLCIWFLWVYSLKFWTKYYIQHWKLLYFGLKFLITFGKYHSVTLINGRSWCIISNSSLLEKLCIWIFMSIFA